MNPEFNGSKIAESGWRQGAVLSKSLSKRALACAPPSVEIASASEDLWLIVVSHDCDIANFRLDKEPWVEVLLARLLQKNRVDKLQSSGRSPRSMQLEIEEEADKVILSLSIHDRWRISREWLLDEAPRSCLPDATRRLVAEWLAKRYIRAGFPSSFDRRWRGKAKEWSKLLRKNSQSIQGVYLRLSTSKELPVNQPYKCHLLIAVPSEKGRRTDWAEHRDTLLQAIEEFWNQFEPEISCVGVEVLGTDEITLREIEPYQRFDADWVSFDDGTPTTPAHVDMRL